MLIRCWGARGSIAVSGNDYRHYGGDTPCIEIRTKDDRIIIVDAGSGIRRLGNRLLAESRPEFAMLFTHAHWDHIMGLPFFKPIYRRESRIVMYGCPFSQESVREMISRVMTPPNFPVSYGDILAEISYLESCTEAFCIGPMTVTPIPISHPNQGIGYRFVEDRKSFVFLTDNELSFRHPGGLSFDDYCTFAKGADLLFHDAEYRPEDYPQTRSWGHSVFKDALRLALCAGVSRFGLFHHNQDRTDQGIDEMVEECRRTAAGHPLDCFAVAQDMEIVL
jgi:phosphoribosyl 1,2-cyclic phosphodiesterase